MPKTSPIYVPIKGRDKLTPQMKAIEARSRKFQAQMNKIGTTLTRGVTLPLAATGIASMKFAKDFNQNMGKVQTLLDGNLAQSTAKAKALKKSLLSMSKDTGKSVNDLAEGLYEVVSAFGEGEKNVGQLDVATRAAVAGQASTIESVKLLSAVTKGYGDTSVEAMKKASDLSFMAVKLGQTTFPELAESMGRVVPFAAGLNTSQEELFGTFATLTGVTGKASEVASEMSAVYAAAMKPSKELTKITKELGFESASAMFKEEGFRGSLEKINTAIDGNSDKLSELFGRKEAMVAVMALINGQADTYAEKNKKMAKVSGATTDAFKKQTEGIGAQAHKWEQLKAKTMAMSIQLGDRLLPIAERFLDRLDPWLEKLEGVSDETLDAAINIGAVAMAIGPLLKLFSRVGPINTFGGAIGGVGKEISGLPGTTKTALGGVGKAFALAGPVIKAAIAGWAIGTAIHQAIIEPAQKKKYERKLSRKDIMFRSKIAAKHRSTTEEKEKLLAELEKLEKKEKRRVHTSMAGKFRTVVPEDIRKAKKDLKEALRKTRGVEAESWMREEGIPFETRMPALVEKGIPFETRMPALVKETKKTTELVHKVKFENLPHGTKIQSPPMPSDVPDNGAILGGT